MSLELVHTIVVGKCLESLMFASLVEDSKHIDSGPPMFNSHETLKDKLWFNLKTYLSLLGRSSNFKQVKKVRVRDDVCKVVYPGRERKYKFNKCVIFDNNIVDVENKILSIKKHKIKIIDEFKISGVSKNYCFNKVTTTDSFVKNIYPYNSGRIDGSKYVTDLQVESFLDKNQINDFQYSDTMVKFKLEDVLTNGDFKLRIAGKLKSGKPKFSRPNLEHVSRTVINQDIVRYKDTKNVIFMHEKNVVKLLNDFEKG